MESESLISSIAISGTIVLDTFMYFPSIVKKGKVKFDLRNLFSSMSAPTPNVVTFV